MLYNKFIDLKIYNSNVAKYDLVDIIYRVIDIMTFGTYGENLLGAFWYIIVLFEVSIIYAMINAISSKSKKREHSLLSLVVLIYALGIICLFYGFHLPRSINTATFVLPLFYLGNMFAKYEDKVPIKLSICIGSLILLLILSSFGEINIGLNIYTNPLFYLASSMSGFYLTIFTSKMLASKFDSSFIGYVGRNTFVIMAYHFLSFKIVHAIYIHLNSYAITRLSEFPVLSPEEPFGWVFYTIVGLLLPLAWKWFYDKIKIWIDRLLNCTTFNNIGGACGKYRRVK
jgi:fucose 4-O-acetylase-like acetyltransferase